MKRRTGVSCVRVTIMFMVPRTCFRTIVNPFLEVYVSATHLDSFACCVLTLKESRLPLFGRSHVSPFLRNLSVLPNWHFQGVTRVFYPKALLIFIITEKLGFDLVI